MPVAVADVHNVNEFYSFNLLNWIFARSSDLYSKFNENIQYNLRTIESGVAVIDEILTHEEEEDFYLFENNQYVEVINRRQCFENMNVYLREQRRAYENVMNNVNAFNMHQQGIYQL
jgi:hypothetical protein